MKIKNRCDLSFSCYVTQGGREKIFQIEGNQIILPNPI